MSSEDGSAYLKQLIEARRLQEHVGHLVGVFTSTEYPHVLAAVAAVDGDVIDEHPTRYRVYMMDGVQWWLTLQVNALAADACPVAEPRRNEVSHRVSFFARLVEWLLNYRRINRKLQARN